MTQEERDQLWPELPFADWKDTCVTLHMWTQIVGKVRLALTPWLNHSWHVTLYVTARGLTTSPIAHHGNVFEIDFDFIDHLLIIRSSTGAERTIALRAMAVADFYNELMSTLTELGFEAKILARQMKSKTQRRFRRILSTRLTTAMRRTASGVCCCKRTAFSRNFARRFSANAVRCTSSGGASISQ